MKRTVHQIDWVTRIDDRLEEWARWFLFYDGEPSGGGAAHPIARLMASKSDWLSDPGDGGAARVTVRTERAEAVEGELERMYQVYHKDPIHRMVAMTYRTVDGTHEKRAMICNVPLGTYKFRLAELRVWMIRALYFPNRM